MRYPLTSVAQSVCAVGAQVLLHGSDTRPGKAVLVSVRSVSALDSCIGTGALQMRGVLEEATKPPGVCRLWCHNTGYHVVSSLATGMNNQSTWAALSESLSGMSSNAGILVLQVENMTNKHQVYMVRVLPCRLPCLVPKCPS